MAPNSHEHGNSDIVPQGPPGAIARNEMLSLYFQQRDPKYNISSSDY